MEHHLAVDRRRETWDRVLSPAIRTALVAFLAFSVCSAAEATPELLLVRFTVPDTLANGAPRPLTMRDTVQFWTRWEILDAPGGADSLQVHADFSELDPGIPGNDSIPGLPQGGGAYVITYPLSGRKTRPDSSGIRIPLTARGRTGTTSDDRIEVCLSNDPPEHVSTRFLRPKDVPYRTGDSLFVETIWRSRDLLPLRVTVDLSQIVVDTTRIDPRVSQLGDNVYQISLRLPIDLENFLPDGEGKHIPVLAFDAGCGSSRSDELRLTIDTTAPSVEGMELDPLPEVTTDDSVTVSGHAPGSAAVLVFREKSRRAVVETDPLTGRFLVRIDLALGQNEIQIKGSDTAGNLTPFFPSDPVRIARVDGAGLTVMNPYSRRDKAQDSEDDIVLRDPRGLQGARLRIYNLEGDCLWEEEEQESGTMELVFHWPATTASGARAPQGYYLVRASWRDGSGQAHSDVQGLYLRD